MLIAILQLCAKGVGIGPEGSADSGDLTFANTDAKIANRVGWE